MKFKNIIHFLGVVSVKRTYVFMFVLSNCLWVLAQSPSDKEPDEISIYFGGGFSSLHHKSASRENFFNGNAVEFGIGYKYYFNRDLGIFIGAGPSIYSTHKLIEHEVFTSGLTDKNGYVFDLRTQTNYGETFNNIFLTIPVMVYYQTRENFQTWWLRQKRYAGTYFMAGIKTCIPLKDTYEAEINGMKNLAYYPQMDNWAATQEFAGLGTFAHSNLTDGNMDFNISLRAALEAGFKWRMGNNLLLYTGLYCDVGIYKTTNKERAPVLNHVAVDHLTSFTLMSFSEKMNAMTAGVIVRLSLSRPPNRTHCPFD